MILTRDQILNASDIGIEKVSVPEWGGEIYVKAMSLGDRNKCSLCLFDTDEKGEQIAKKDVDYNTVMLAFTLCDKKGKLIFSEEDIEAISNKSTKATDRCLEVAKRLNNFTEEEVDNAEKK